MKIPTNLSHTPIIGVDYESKDASAGDAKFLSLGKATWANGHNDYSAKVFRLTNEGTKHKKWSRQSEELPLWRVLDLATLLVASIQHTKSILQEELIGSQDDLKELNAFLDENHNEYAPRLMELRRLLTEESDVESDVAITGKTPNIFSFATSELSQDAMLAWIISWANHSFKEYDASLYDAAVKMLRDMLGRDFNFSIEKVKVIPQKNRIDIGVEVNDNMFLIIEDKTNTSIHDNQLDRYREIAKKKYKGVREVYCVYVKTGNETKKKIDLIENNLKYKVIDREKIIKSLKDYSGGSDLVKYFLAHLTRIEEDTKSFEEKPYKEWSWYAWQGFYMELEKHLDIDDWGYVANPAGGFLAIWWKWVCIEDEKYGLLHIYLQIEAPKNLCVKIEFKGKQNLRSSVRDYYKRKLLAKARELGISIQGPERLGNGTYMTIGIVNLKDIIGEKLNIENTIDKLKSYENLVSQLN